MNPNTPKRPIADHYESRATIDLDAKGGGLELRAMQCWHNLGEIADAVDVHVSSSGRGLHFVAYFAEPLEYHEKLAIRRANHDDKRRVEMELQRWLAGLPTDVLFAQKDDDAGGGRLCKERRFADVYDALDHIKAQRDDHAAVKRLAQSGHKGAPHLAPKATRRTA